ncbi:MAG: hypothetical protein HETSPECPRED_006377 [Heterodermia speciosa]|uniref:Carboxylic ester hydrolase n=1 Tax=Heterodermia speciosa TaxID=116794 RepID=A0A8H3FIL5_9LECA|nr:MAG: hypothetical protein HETSPECPRED_006377 [Heterodermia speciosa]
MSLLKLCALVFFTIISQISTYPFNPRPFDQFLSTRQPYQYASNDLLVDLGYEQYQGVHDEGTGLNTWKGVRYAAAPIGALRWQAPQAPLINRGEVLRADALPPRCPQSPAAPTGPDFDFTGNEDCLFLSVYAPPNKTNLPVLVWIHGGGYGLGQGDQDMSSIINTNDNSFIGVTIQYRLGAFGFLSSDEVYRYGTTNAGIKDQTFALQWVQSYIGLFGGDPSAVTISGESSGAGAVMLQVLAFGGNLGTSLFRQGIASSPYLPQQWNYGDYVPSRSYYAFAQAVGCFPGYDNPSASIFQCLVSKDTNTLQNASAFVSGSGRYETWGFLPVTDGSYIQQLPSQQLLKKQVNGENILVGNNANDGVRFAARNIVTEADFIGFLRDSFPLFTDGDIEKVLFYYPSTSASVDPSIPKFATSGDDGATALNESTYDTGQQQRANNVFAETTFVCPSYWLTEAFSNRGRTGYKYQYSVIGAQHGLDVSGIFGPPTPNQSPDFTRAFMSIWGNFVTTGNPSISAAIAAGSKTPSNDDSTTSAATNFPPFSVARPYQLNLNETGGTPYSAPGFVPTAPNITQFEEPGLKNSFRLVNAYTWEGGRGTRCDFWRSVAKIVPE